MTVFDLMVVADPRQRGADGRCLAAMLEAAAEAGYRTALLARRGPGPAPAIGFAPGLRRLLQSRKVTWLDPGVTIEARLALVHHLRPLREGTASWCRVRTGQALLRVDQPTASAGGESLVDLARMRREAEALLGIAPEIVPADPLVAAHLRLAPTIASTDLSFWPAITTLSGPDADELPTTLRRIGRHCLGGTGALPPPELHAAAYPGHAPFEVRLAEAAVALATGAPLPPPSWRLAPGELDDAQAFLANLDAYVFATASSWQPFGLPGLIEALAAAPVLVLPPALEPLFGDAAAYYPPDPEALTAFLAEHDPAAARRRRRAAQALHRRSLGPEALVGLLRARIGPPAGAAPRLGLRRDVQTPRNVLFLSPNGVGMGHLTRLLAIARRCPGPVRPVILSMSQAVGVVERFGFLGEYLPYHEHTGENAEAWAIALQARLNEAIAFYDARCVVFDGNVPYQGLIRARLDNPSRPFVWIRRGMWRAEAGRAVIDRERHFDLVIEPGEYAALDDPGITAKRERGVARVPPITLLEPEEMLDRDAARAELGLDPHATAIIVQLGGRNNFDYAQIDAILAKSLERRPDVQTLVLEWLIGERPSGPPPGFRSLRTFPAARFLHAFDLAISACGYNSFHELLRSRLPSILVPNENPMMDAQEVRALWADRHGRAFCVRRSEPYRLAWALERLLDPAGRQELATHAPLPPCSGAAAAAQLIAELAGSTANARLDQRPHQALLR